RKVIYLGNNHTLELLFLLVGPGPSLAALFHRFLVRKGKHCRCSFSPSPHCTLTSTVHRSGWINSRTSLRHC
uniref:Uncharacterized protein n=1 Tax=Apteryx owenii TaxID=8824 RepID=A0A8B9NYW6_APTOW